MTALLSNFASSSSSIAPRPSPDQATVAAWAKQLEFAEPNQIIQFAVDHFGESLAVATQFGIDGCSLLHRTSQISRRPYFFTIDTGLLFEETLGLASRLEGRLGITIHRRRPEQSVAAQALRHGPNLWERDPDLCCTVRKVIPMKETLDGFGAWMTSIRRDQSPSRQNTPVVAWDEKFGLVKFAPLANVTAQDVESYVRHNSVPTNPLRQIGYQSLGCFTCTRPSKDKDDERAGRWSGSSKTECGLHTL